jgi:hypothetical protein
MAGADEFLAGSRRALSGRRVIFRFGVAAAAQDRAPPQASLNSEHPLNAAVALVSEFR